MATTNSRHVCRASRMYGRVLIVCVAVGMLGCNERPKRNVKLAPVTGTVAYENKPLSHGQIVLVHDSGEMGASEIRSDGTYDLKAAVGKNRVMIECTDEPNLSEVDPKAGRALRMPKSFIPLKYRDYQSSGLTIDVVDGSNHKDWDLSD